MTIYLIDVYLYVRIDVWKTLTKKRKQHPPQRDDASTVSAATCRVWGGEQGEARPAISAPKSGPHLDLGRLRLKTLPKSDFWIAETWPTYLYIYLQASPSEGYDTDNYSGVNNENLDQERY